jgi:hypothetical protein
MKKARKNQRVTRKIPLLRRPAASAADNELEKETE